MIKSSQPKWLFFCNLLSIFLTQFSFAPHLLLLLLLALLLISFKSFHRNARKLYDIRFSFLFILLPLPNVWKFITNVHISWIYQVFFIRYFLFFFLSFLFFSILLLLPLYLRPLQKWKFTKFLLERSTIDIEIIKYTHMPIRKKSIPCFSAKIFRAMRILR